MQKANDGGRGSVVVCCEECEMVGKSWSQEGGEEGALTRMHVTVGSRIHATANRLFCLHSCNSSSCHSLKSCKNLRDRSLPTLRFAAFPHPTAPVSALQVNTP